MFILDTACSIGGTPIPDFILKTIAYLIQLIKIGVPILMIVFGMVDLGKAVVAKKKEDMQKYMNLFFKKLITAAMVFFVISITLFVLRLLYSAETNGRSTNGAFPTQCIKKIIGERT